jgi:hypothetical protein
MNSQWQDPQLRSVYVHIMLSVVPVVILHMPSLHYTILLYIRDLHFAEYCSQLESKCSALIAGVAQLGEQQTEVRVHSGGPVFNPRSWHFCHFKLALQHQSIRSSVE